jgi:thiamine biosynthesis lipoprotein
MTAGGPGTEATSGMGITEGARATDGTATDGTGAPGAAEASGAAGAGRATGSGAVGRDSFGIFGTTAVLLVTDAAAIGVAREIADAELAAVDAAASRFRDDSELTALNRAGGAARPVSPLFADLIAAALRAARLTDGAVDPTCAAALASLGYDRDFAEVRAGRPESAQSEPAHSWPAQARPAQARPAQGASGLARPVPGWGSVVLDAEAGRVRLRDGAQLDLGATAKAWAADRCAELIAARLGGGVLVSLGGDIAVAGPPPDGGWQVRVTDDHAAGPDAPGQTVTITEGGLATSSVTVRAWASGGEQVHHIIDPATGRPAAVCWRTVSVAAGTCTDANTASTAAIVRGTAAPGWLRAAGLPARLVRPDGSVVTTAGWPADPGDDTDGAGSPDRAKTAEASGAGWS